MDKFTEGYVECAFWSSTDDNGKPLDSIDAESAPETIARMEADCAKFQAENEGHLSRTSCDAAHNGRDFWLTRNHHGAGFWECDYSDEITGEALTKAAHAFGECDLYIGDDGRIYAQ